MPVLEFKGKHHIYAHHLSVPYHQLKLDESRSCNSSSEEDNLIIHGDNLHALKALLPYYANRVKCVYIDPPYNTGNEGWIYDDNVNNPPMQEWFEKHSPIDTEDMERHDKWLCMMWPRLHLLKELLADDGVIFISIDDNELHHLRMLMDEIFSPENFVTQFVWNKKNVVQNDAKFASVNHEYIVCYRKSGDFQKFNLLPRSEKANQRYKNPDKDPRGPWQSVALQAKSGRPKDVYTVTFPNGVTWTPPSGTFPKFTKDRLLSLYKDRYLFFGKEGQNVPRLKKYLSEVKSGMVSNSILTTDEVGSTQSATQAVNSIMGGNVFNSPKSVRLIQHIILLTTGPDDIILDSFAGSGTTAHAVLALNKENGGNRKFILVECEDYADNITAERVRRVINGIENTSDKGLKEGLGGSFTYCTLGKPTEIEGMLTGESLPTYSVLAAHLLFAATGVSVGDEKLEQKNDDGLFYSDEKNDYYLLYQPDLEFLSSDEAILKEEHAKRIRDTGSKNGKKAIVYAAGNYIGQRGLTKMGIVFAQLPYALHEK